MTLKSRQTQFGQNSFLKTQRKEKRWDFCFTKRCRAKSDCFHSFSVNLTWCRTGFIRETKFYFHFAEAANLKVHRIACPFIHCRWGGATIERVDRMFIRTAPWDESSLVQWCPKRNCVFNSVHVCSCDLSLQGSRVWRVLTELILKHWILLTSLRQINVCIYLDMFGFWETSSELLLVFVMMLSEHFFIKASLRKRKIQFCEITAKGIIL